MPCRDSLEPFAAIFTEYLQERVFGGHFRIPAFRVFQQNKPNANVTYTLG